MSAFTVAVAIVEVGYTLLAKRAPPHMFERRYLLFSGGGPLFRNEGRIFTYMPGSRFRAVAYYDVDGRWVKEYDYTATTNNEGLVQSRDVVPGKPSILFLGDSFTEGMGAPPWIDGVASASHNSPVQFVNGGILGTGPAQWLLLHDHLVNRGVQPAKVVVIFISDDFLRDIWNIPVHTIRCIEMATSCLGNENYHGRPSDTDLPAFLERLRLFRLRALESKDWKTIVANTFTATHLAYRTVKELIGVKPAAVSLNEEAIYTLITRYKSNILFIHLPQKDEIKLGITNRPGLRARAFIKSHGGEVAENLQCQLILDDYYPHDAHPNVHGYEKIGRCVQDIIQRKWPEFSAGG